MATSAPNTAPKPSANISSLPTELLITTLQYLTDLDDVRNAIRASKAIHRVYEGNKAAIVKVMIYYSFSDGLLEKAFGIKDGEAKTEWIDKHVQFLTEGVMLYLKLGH